MTHVTRVEKDATVREEFIRQWNADVGVKQMLFNFSISTSTLVKWRKKLKLKPRPSYYGRSDPFYGEADPLVPVTLKIHQSILDNLDIVLKDTEISRSKYIRTVLKANLQEAIKPQTEMRT